MMIVDTVEQKEVPIIVDLDGTLLRGDLLFESVILFLKKEPYKILHIIVWLLKGIAFLKRMLAQQVKIDVTNLPYNKLLIEYLKSEYASGRDIVLATASHLIYAKQIADYIGIFSQIYATDGAINLKGSKKLKLIISEFGEKGFDYIGDSTQDLKIFPHSKKATLVNKKIYNSAKRVNQDNIQIAFDNQKNYRVVILKAVRIHQWLKNLLLFVPVFTSHTWFNLSIVLNCLAGFIAISLCASGTYLLNDLFDLQSDRIHPQKKDRPMAAGDLSIFSGVVLLVGLLTFGLTVAFFLSKPFFVCLLVYLLITVTYSLKLKSFIMVDVVALASLYTIRVVAGAVLINVQISFWLLAFSNFLFFSLALVKRCTELQVLKIIGKNEVKGRDYLYKDLQTIRSMGISSGFLSVVVFSLYLNSTEVLSLYSQPKILWLICPVLLYWISRLWIKTGREEMHDDPVVYAIKDMASIIILCLAAILVVAATYVKI